ncbi:peptidase s8 s53 subtilisin kexin sedolisin protein [Diplodia corticola]|uniref:Peptidase s8 s53 subtilisin kexin sedolisin protein n=1 Tax=Diplodia corticola TaxID=236234 RepID=A0A1J9RUT7_9PEZI|nr:peptidase s8 s53 subtilisin kexin sedolisin protein [Diplodia corticola]OJD32183.1 peptidase s8 s53 subtilisin kexin sedolisin protein [Diplodia corticola]
MSTAKPGRDIPTVALRHKQKFADAMKDRPASWHQGLRRSAVQKVPQPQHFEFQRLQKGGSPKMMFTPLILLSAGLLGALAAPSQLLPKPRANTREYDIVMVPDADIASVLGILNLNLHVEDVLATYNNTLFKGFSGTMTAEEATILGAMPHVLAIDEVIEANIAESRDNAPWGLQRISQKETIHTSTYPLAREFEYRYDSSSSLGRGVDVYVLDTGIFTSHSEFGGRASMGYTYWKGNNTDGHGHGTHCAGTIAGATVGVASNANLIGIKVLSDAGPGPSTALLAGLNYIATQHDSRSADADFVASVMSMSFGFEERSSAIETAIQKLVQAGVHAAIAAGNSATNACTVTPAALGGSGSSTPVLTVAAATFDDRVADFSNTGPCVDVFAPGVWVASAGIGATDEYTVKSGTSMATPHVAGLVAARAADVDVGSSSGAPGEVKRWVVEGAVRGVLVGRGGEVASEEEESGEGMVLAYNGVGSVGEPEGERKSLFG